jgi:hypothetical protein
LDRSISQSSVSVKRSPWERLRDVLRPRRAGQRYKTSRRKNAGYHMAIALMRLSLRRYPNQAFPPGYVDRPQGVPPAFSQFDNVRCNVRGANGTVVRLFTFSFRLDIREQTPERA